MVEDREARAVFDRLVRIKVGKGDRVMFWRDRWIRGLAVADITPLVLATVQTRIVNMRTVQQALQGNRWVADCQPEASFVA